MEQPFTGLYAQHYDVLFPLDTDELFFYQALLKRSPGWVLEIGCGTGTLLIGLCAFGCDVHGLDCSKPMLTRAAHRAHQAGIAIPLYHQACEELNLPCQFQSIIVSSCSFMFVTDYHQAQQTLQRLYKHLAPGGQLITTSFLPYQEMMSGQFERHCIRDVALDASSQLTVYQTVDYDHVRQLRTCVLDFELWRAGIVHQQEQQSFLYRWYGVNELIAMVKAAGFGDITVYGDYQLQPIAADTETVIVVAHKPL